MPTRVRVIIADDHPLFLAGLCAALRSWPEIELAGAAADGEEALLLLRSAPADVALLDMRMPGLDGLAVARRAAEEEDAPRVIFLSAETRPDVVYEAIAAGARGYLSKDTTAQGIYEAVLAVARGGTVLPAEARDGLLASLRDRHAHSEGPRLSPRERDVVRLAAAGRSAAASALDLGISEGTVKTHLQNAYEKLGVSDRAAAVAAAMRAGVIT